MKSLQTNNDFVGTSLAFIYGLIGGTEIINALLLGAAGYLGSKLANFCWAYLSRKKD